MEYIVAGLLLLNLFCICVWMLLDIFTQKKNRSPFVIRGWQFTYSLKRLAERYPDLDPYNAAIEAAAEEIKEVVKQELEYTSSLPLDAIRVRWEPCKKRRDPRE